MSDAMIKLIISIAQVCWPASVVIVLWVVAERLPGVITNWHNLAQLISASRERSVQAITDQTKHRNLSQERWKLSKFPHVLILVGFLSISLLHLSAGPVEVWHVVTASLGVALMMLGFSTLVLQIILAALLMIYNSEADLFIAALKSRDNPPGAKETAADE